MATTARHSTKFARLDPQTGATSDPYQDRWSRQETTGPGRLVVAPRAGRHVDVLLELARCLREPSGSYTCCCCLEPERTRRGATRAPSPRRARRRRRSSVGSRRKGAEVPGGPPADTLVGPGDRGAAEGSAGSERLLRSDPLMRLGPGEDRLLRVDGARSLLARLGATSRIIVSAGGVSHSPRTGTGTSTSHRGRPGRIQPPCSSHRCRVPPASSPCRSAIRSTEPS